MYMELNFDTERSKDTCRYAYFILDFCLMVAPVDILFSGRASVVTNLRFNTTYGADCFFISGEVRVRLCEYGCVFGK